MRSGIKNWKEPHERMRRNERVNFTGFLNFSINHDGLKKMLIFSIISRDFIGF